DHVDIGEPIFRHATDPLDARGREQGGDDRIRDLVLDQRRAPPWPLGKDDRLHIRQVRDRIQRHLEDSPHPTSRQQQHAQDNQDRVAGAFFDEPRNHLFSPSRPAGAKTPAFPGYMPPPATANWNFSEIGGRFGSVTLAVTAHGPPMPSRAFASYTPSLAWVAFTVDSIIPGIGIVYTNTTWAFVAPEPAGSMTLSRRSVSPALGVSGTVLKVSEKPETCRVSDTGLPGSDFIPGIPFIPSMPSIPSFSPSRPGASFSPARPEPAKTGSFSRGTPPFPMPSMPSIFFS